MGAFLNETRGKNAPPGLERLQQRTGEIRGRSRAERAVGSRNATASGENAGGAQTDADGLDLYFPVKAHREKWKGDGNLLVAFAPMGDEVDVSEIVAYSVKNGKRIRLDPAREPDQAVLVIAMEEHGSHEAVAPTKQDEPQAAEREKPNFEGGNPLQPEREAIPSNSVHGIKYLKIFDGKEPWYKGDPEIYLLFGRAQGNSCVVGRYECAAVNDENRWYDLDRWHKCKPQQVDERQSALWPVLDPKRDKLVVFIFEDDSRYSDRDGVFLDHFYPGITCAWHNGIVPSAPDRGDDLVQLIWTFRSLYPYGSDYYRRVGNAYLVWRKDP